MVWTSLVRRAFVLPVLGARPTAAERAARIREIVHAHVDAICRTARRLGVSRADVEDVVQDVLLIVVRRLEHIEPDKERAFIIGTTVRVTQNSRRRRRRRPEDPSDAVDRMSLAVDTLTATRHGMQGELLVEQRQKLALLHTALNAMTEAQRVAFILFELEELTAREVAEQLGVTEATIVSRVRRGREVLWRVCEGRFGEVAPLAAREHSEVES